MELNKLGSKLDGGYDTFTRFFNEELKPFALGLLKKDGGHIPIVISVSRSGLDSMDMTRLLHEIDGLGDSDARAAGKDLMASLVNGFVLARESFAYVYISECWYATNLKDEEVEDCEVRNRSDKEEALAFTWEFNCNGTEKAGSTIVPFYRHDDDNIITMKEISHTSDGSTTSGRFSGILV